MGEELMLPDEIVLDGADFRGRWFDYLPIGEGSRLTGCDCRDTWIRDGNLEGGRKPPRRTAGRSRWLGCSQQRLWSVQSRKCGLSRKL